MLRACLAEGLGTFILVFAGTGAVVVDVVSHGAVTHLGVSFVFGAVVSALIYTFGPISGAHFNPAVTLALASMGRFPIMGIFPYLLSQLLGAVLGSLGVGLGLGWEADLGATLPLQGNWPQAFGVELLLTFILMLVICGSALHPQAVPGTAGIAIGLTVGLEAAFAGPISGASMNPARSFGPALVSGIWTSHWVYWVAPIAGALLAARLWTYLLEEQS